MEELFRMKSVQFFSTRLIHKGSFENIIIGVEKSGVEFNLRDSNYIELFL